MRETVVGLAMLAMISASLLVASLAVLYLPWIITTGAVLIVAYWLGKWATEGPMQ